MDFCGPRGNALAYFVTCIGGWSGARRLFSGLAASIASGTLLGCAALPKTESTDQLRVGDVDIVTKSAERQFIIFKTVKGQQRFCMTPPPDAVQTFSEDVSVSVGRESIGESGGEGAGILGGRGQAVLVLRELFFRVCEYALNYDLDEETARALYQKAMRLVEKVGVSSAQGEGPVSSSLSVPAYESPQPGGDSGSDK